MCIENRNEARLLLRVVSDAASAACESMSRSKVIKRGSTTLSSRYQSC